jgi:hypothetical protein
MINKKVVDVQGAKDAEGQKVIVWNRHNRSNQRWRVVYMDKSSKDIWVTSTNSQWY